MSGQTTKEILTSSNVQAVLWLIF